mgnify:CR=1 FL=1
MTKSFHVTEQARFQLYSSFNNVLNHPRWGFPNTNVFSTTFGVVGAPTGGPSITLRALFAF